MSENMYCPEHKATNDNFRNGYDNMIWDATDEEIEELPNFRENVWKRYNKLKKEGKI